MKDARPTMRIVAAALLAMVSGVTADKYDAVVVPGGGLDHESREPAAWVVARLNSALELDEQTRYYIVLSRGTPHRAPPRDGADFPVDESVASARYLMKRGVAASRILLDTWSLDTIGNAYFARTAIAEPLRLHRMCVVTSAFHARRTRAIFEWIFSLDSPQPAFVLDYKVSEDVGMAADVLEARRSKEQGSLQRLVQNTVTSVQSMAALAQFLLVNHGAYSAEGSAKEKTSSCTAAASSY